MSNTFSEFAAAVAERLRSFADRELYVVDVDADALWSTYLASFPEGTNPIFRERTEHDCACCRTFIRNMGGLVALNADGSRSTVWDVVASEHYATVARALHDTVHSASIRGVFRTQEGSFGTESTLEDMGDHVHVWHHFHGAVPKRCKTLHATKELGRLDTTARVLKRGLRTLTVDALDQVRELIEHGSLYRGEEHGPSVEAFHALRVAYDGSAEFVWRHVHDPCARFRNTAIGTLVEDISEGMDLEAAVARFEKKVAPQNYKRTTSPITTTMIKGALETLRGLGLETAVERRYARLSDVSVNNVLFVDNAARGQMKDGLAGLLMEAVKTPTTMPKGGQSVSSDAFFGEVLRGASAVSLFLENKHANNFASLTAPVDPDVGRLFTWHNNFAWSYDGDVADSIRERVKRAGGNVECLMRVSLSWFNYDDLDIHCTTPTGTHIYFNSKRGILDVDMNAGSGKRRDAVENLAFKRLRNGVYKIWVNQYARRETVDLGFEIEFAYKGRTERFTYDRAVVGDVAVMEIHVRNGVVHSVVEGPDIIRGSAPIDKWGVRTQALVPVDTIMVSPNHWDDHAIGNRHHFFLLHGCKNPGSTRGIYNEFLRRELHDHRKVFEVLGAKTKCAPSDEQLSGVGFSSTRRDEATFVVTKGSHTRTYHVQF